MQRGRGALFARPISLIIIQILILFVYVLLWTLWGCCGRLLSRDPAVITKSVRDRERENACHYHHHQASGSPCSQCGFTSHLLDPPPQNTSRSLPLIRNASLKCRSFPGMFAMSVEQVYLEYTMFCFRTSWLIFKYSTGAATRFI
jgi:hypothetical protein